jgi:hypothetical protein
MRGRHRRPRASTAAASRLIVGLVIVTLPLVLVPSAAAVPPTLLTVGTQALHPTATFSAPKSDDVVIQIASKPDRASSGEFLTENVVVFDLLADSEIQTGRWLYESQIDPGTYYVLLRASPDFDLCYLIDSGTYDPSCADGYSAMQTLTIPRPAIRYGASVRHYVYLSNVDLTITAVPLGQKMPYRVCYRTAARRRVCLDGVISGYSWTSSASDTRSVNRRNLRTVTTFTWYVEGRAVVTKRARVR